MRRPTIFSAASAGTTFRPTSTYTTLRDVTEVCGNDYRWVAAVVIDHPRPPSELVSHLGDAKHPAIVLLRRDWQFVFDQLKSTYAVAQYIERVAGEEAELGLESVRYYDCARSDTSAEPAAFPAELLGGGRVLSAPLLPLAPAATDNRDAHVLLRTLLEDIANTHLHESSEKDRLRLLGELDRLPIGQRAEAGRFVLDAMAKLADDVLDSGVIWRMRRFRA